MARVERGKSPELYLRDLTQGNMLTRADGFAQNGLIGQTGVINNDKGVFTQRVAVFYHGSKAYFLQGKVNKAIEGVDYDELFLTSIKSFRPEQRVSKSRKSLTIHYVKAKDKTRIEDLAQHIPLGVYTEQHLRLINGLYPRKEPKPGDWIKIVQ